MFDGSTLIGIVLLLAGGTFLWYGFRSYATAMESRNWLQTSGVITAARLKRVAAESDDAVKYRGLISYEYFIGSDRFSSSAIAAGKEHLELTEAQALGLADSYPLGGSVTVFYDPANPARAVLETGEGGQNILVVVAGAGFVVAGIAVALS